MTFHLTSRACSNFHAQIGHILIGRFDRYTIQLLTKQPLDCWSAWIVVYVRVSPSSGWLNWLQTSYLPSTRLWQLFNFHLSHWVDTLDVHVTGLCEKPKENTPVFWPFLIYWVYLCIVACIYEVVKSVSADFGEMNKCTIGEHTRKKASVEVKCYLLSEMKQYKRKGLKMNLYKKHVPSRLWSGVKEHTVTQ